MFASFVGGYGQERVPCAYTGAFRFCISLTFCNGSAEKMQRKKSEEEKKRILLSGWLKL
jgi:hypothetical protein